VPRFRVFREEPMPISKPAVGWQSGMQNKWRSPPICKPDVNITWARGLIWDWWRQNTTNNIITLGHRCLTRRTTHCILRCIRVQGESTSESFIFETTEEGALTKLCFMSKNIV
jgi:hypothetical protein